MAESNPEPEKSRLDLIEEAELLQSHSNVLKKLGLDESDETNIKFEDDDIADEEDTASTKTREKATGQGKLDRATKVAYEIAKNKRAMGKASKKAIELMTPASALLRGNWVIQRMFAEKWDEMDRDQKIKAIQNPSTLKMIFGGPFFVKHKIDQYTLSGLLLIGAIGGGAEDESIIKEFFTPGLAEKAVNALLSLGSFIEPELAPLAEMTNVFTATKERGLRVCEVVRRKSIVKGVRLKTREQVANVIPANIAPQQKRKAA